MSTPILTVAPTGTWNLDPVHSRVDFEVSYLAGMFKGEFHEIGAELTVDAERVSLEGTAKVASVDVRDQNLSAHLQSPAFFDAERDPDPGHLRQPSPRLAQHEPVARRGGGSRPGRPVRALRRPEGDSAVRRGRRCAPPPGKRRALEPSDRDRGCGALCDAGVQLVHPGPAEERDRLDLASGGDEHAAEQAGGRGWREHGRVRGGLGTG